MAKFDVVDMSGKKVSTVELSDAVFGITPNEKAVHEAVVNFLAIVFSSFTLSRCRGWSRPSPSGRGWRP